MDEQLPLPVAQALRAEARCVVETVVLLAGRRLRLPPTHRGEWLRFGDGTSSRVYRETVVDGRSAADPAVLVVGFRLRLVRGRLAHALFRLESVLNTPLFVGFPGFVSKLWMTNDANGLYRGVYQWDGAQRAEDYARALWWVLALVSVRGSIRHHVVPGLRRDEFLRSGTDGAGAAQWWYPVSAPVTIQR